MALALAASALGLPASPFSADDVLRPANMEAACPIPSTEPTFYSQSNEDKFVYEKFFAFPLPRCGGTVLELGALDGKKFSNSKFFDDHLGWKSILIEPNSANYAKLVQNRGPSPRAELHHAAVCAGDSVTFEGAGATGGISGEMNDDHKRIFGTTEKYTVPCITLAQALAKYNHIDAAFVDVEGGELVVLQTMDWRIPVGVWVVELDGDNKEKDEKVRQLLTSNGYRKVTEWNIRDYCPVGGDCTTNEVFVPVQALDQAALPSSGERVAVGRNAVRAAGTLASAPAAPAAATAAPATAPMLGAPIAPVAAAAPVAPLPAPVPAASAALIVDEARREARKLSANTAPAP